MEAVLVLNPGSSSLKYAAYGVARDRTLTPLTRGKVEGGDTAKILDLLEGPLEGRKLSAVGHRVVHGGPRLYEPTPVDDSVLAEIEALVPLDPSHQKASADSIRQARSHWPSPPHVACFDTAFHRGRPAVADAVALPRALRDGGIRRYGFHGLSYEYVSGRLREIAPGVAGGRVVIAHLGSGASLCALRDGKSVDCTMSYTALDGLVMGTRAGSLDASVVLHLWDEGWNRERISRLLWHESGLLGLSGTSADMRTLLATETPEARFAVDAFVYGVVKGVGSMAAALGGLDGLVFTGGIGENAVEIRARVMGGLDWLGLTLDHRANSRGQSRISPAESRAAAFMIPTDEERTIALHTIRCLDEEFSKS